MYSLENIHKSKLEEKYNSEYTVKLFHNTAIHDNIIIIKAQTINNLVI